MTTTFDRLCVLLATDTRLTPDRLRRDATLDSLGIDSLGTVELLWNVEDAFRIKLPSEPVELSTLGDVARYVDELLAAQAAAPAPATAVVPGLHAG